MKILVADDEPASRLVLSAVLRKMGHEVTVVEDGAQAWHALLREHFTILITDWMMPEMDGLALARRVREEKPPPYTYVLMLTGLSGKTHYLEGMRAGADDFVTKPVDPEGLAARLRVAERILGLQDQVRQLEGLLPICMYCKRIEEAGDGGWTQVESYVARRTEASFSHGICPECMETRARVDVERWKRSRSGQA